MAAAAMVLLQVNPALAAESAAPATANMPLATQPIPFGQLLHHSRNFFDAYRGETVPPPDMANSLRLNSLIRDGKLYLSLRDAIDLALENNLDIVIARYNLPIALADIQRTAAGGQVRGVNTGVVSGTPGGGAGGAGAGAGAGGTTSGAGGAGAGAAGLVQSTVGVGTNVSTFDPVINAQTYIDHTSAQLTNRQIYGVPVLHDNTTLGNVTYQQAFPTGTAIQVNFNNSRQTFNSPYEALNPQLYSYFQFGAQQQLLAGFGLGPNLRYLRIARTNRKISDIAFKAQVIATVDQIATIYWDLVNAYDDEQVNERSVAFAAETLETSRKQFALQAIAEMDVLKAEGELAQRQQDLAISRTNLELEELYMKNAITRSFDDPMLAEMPVVPTDRIGGTIEPDSRSVQEEIELALKNRVDLQEQALVLENSELSRKTARNALLPQLALYGFYSGTGYAGTPNPDYTQGAVSAPAGFGGAVQNAFNNSSPEYQVGFQLSVPLRNRIAKADQYRAELEYRQSQVGLEEAKKRILIDVRNTRYALEQGASRVAAARNARDLAARTLDIMQKEQKLGAGSNQQTLAAEHDLAVAESTLAAAETAYEKSRIEVLRATGTLLDNYGIAISGAKSGTIEADRHD